MPIGQVLPHVEESQEPSPPLATPSLPAGPGHLSTAPPSSVSGLRCPVCSFSHGSPRMFPVTLAIPLSFTEHGSPYLPYPSSSSGVQPLPLPDITLNVLVYFPGDKIPQQKELKGEKPKKAAGARSNWSHPQSESRKWRMLVLSSFLLCIQSKIPPQLIPHAHAWMLNIAHTGVPGGLSPG